MNKTEAVARAIYEREIVNPAMGAWERDYRRLNPLKWENVPKTSRPKYMADAHAVIRAVDNAGGLHAVDVEMIARAIYEREPTGWMAKERMLFRKKGPKKWETAPTSARSRCIGDARAALKFLGADI